MGTFRVGDLVKCVNSKPLEGNEIAPKLVEGEEYRVKDIILDKGGNQHLDVGLNSEVNFVRSWDTKEELPNGQNIHWCHPSRFQNN